MMEPESNWLDKLKCRLGLHSWWIAPNAQVWLFEEEINAEEETVAMNVIPPDLVGHAKFCVHCKAVHGVIVNNKLVKLKGVKVVYVE